MEEEIDMVLENPGGEDMIEEAEEGAYAGDNLEDDTEEEAQPVHIPSHTPYLFCCTNQNILREAY